MDLKVVQVSGTALKKSDVRPEAVSKLEEAFANLVEQHDQQLGCVWMHLDGGEGSPSGCPFLENSMPWIVHV